MNEIDRLKSKLKQEREKNKQLKEEFRRRKREIIKELDEFVDCHYKDNKKFYKGKGIGLNYLETNYVLLKLKALKEDNNV